MMPTLTARQHLNRRIGDMRAEQSSWIPHWKDLIANFAPRRGKFSESDRNNGNKRNFLNNNTPLFAKRTLVSGLMTGITSPARPWFRLSTPDAELANFGPVRAWLDDVEKMMYRVFASSNLYKCLPTLYEETSVIGTAAMIQEEDFETITRFTPFSAGEYMLDINGDLRVDTFAREYQQTAYQVASKFTDGDDLSNLSTATRTNLDNSNYSAVVDIKHVIEPVSMSDHESLKLLDDFKWRSVYYEPGKGDEADKFLRVKGYRDFPIHAPRWDAKAGDTYGFSVGMDALGDSRQLQVQEKEKGKAIAKMVAPPTFAPTKLANSNVSVMPGAVNFTDDANAIFKPIYQVNPQVDHLNMDIRQTEDRINRAFYVDLFLMISQQDDVRTATEIAARQEEKLLQLGPVLEGLQDDLLDPLIDRTFDMLVRLSGPGWKGTGPQLLPPPPPELQGVKLKVEYISILAQAQKLVSTGAMERWVGFTGQLAALKPEVLDKINGDEITDIMAEDLGVPVKAVNGEDEVTGIRKARAEQEQQMQMQAQMAAMVDSAKTLGDTPTTGGNVLNDVVGVGGAQQ